MADAVYTTLTDSDKLSIVTQHIRNKEFAMYGEEVDYLEEVASATPNQVALDGMTARKVDNTVKLTALQTEQTRLNAAIATARAVTLTQTPTPTTGA